MGNIPKSKSREDIVAEFDKLSGKEEIYTASPCGRYSLKVSKDLTFFLQKVSSCFFFLPWRPLYRHLSFSEEPQTSGASLFSICVVSRGFLRTPISVVRFSSSSTFPPGECKSEISPVLRPDSGSKTLDYMGKSPRHPVCLRRIHMLIRTRISCESKSTDGFCGFATRKVEIFPCPLLLLPTS